MKLANSEIVQFHLIVNQMRLKEKEEFENTDKLEDCNKILYTKTVDLLIEYIIKHVLIVGTEYCKYNQIRTAIDSSSVELELYNNLVTIYGSSKSKSCIAVFERMLNDTAISQKYFKYITIIDTMSYQGEMGLFEIIAAF